MSERPHRPTRSQPKTIVVAFACLAFLLPRIAPAAAPLPDFDQTGPFGEQVHWMRLPSGVRVMIDAPATLGAPRRLLVIYATPNGNTLEQTLGCKPAKGLDWRFDIQHVAAQVRCYRELDSTQDVFLAVVQSPKLSWPTFRAEHADAGRIIRDMVDELVKLCSADRVVLACHSGGGSFVLGYIATVDAIPTSVERIILLDANYSYSDADHGDKLLAWLRADRAHQLAVIAYDDREITFNGKKVVGPGGGTFRASERMLARLRRDVELADRRRGPFRHVSDAGGQIDFLVHLNPDNKILHTALVGEMNGLVHALTLHTPHEEAWGRFDGPRAYGRWIQPEPFAEPPEKKGDWPKKGDRHHLPGRPEGCSAQMVPVPFFHTRLALPPRPADAPTGSEFARQIDGLSLPEREAAIAREITRGNVPEFLRRLAPVAVTSVDTSGVKHRGVCFVTPDYLAIGSDDDFFRVPMTPNTAMRLADALECSLMTAKLSDDVFAAAEVKLDPRPMTENRQSVATFLEHNRLIEKQLAGRAHGQLVAGVKKDVVLTNRLKKKPHRVAIYGWHYPSGRPIQPLYVGHVDQYVDYSHGVRLVAGRMLVDGRQQNLSAVLADPRLCGLLSNEGPLDPAELRRAAGW